MMMYRMSTTTGKNNSIAKAERNLIVQLLVFFFEFNLVFPWLLTKGEVCDKIYVIQQNKNFVELAIGRSYNISHYKGISMMEAVLWLI